MKINARKTAILGLCGVGVSIACVVALTGHSSQRQSVECFNNLNQIDSAIINLALANGYKQGDRVPIDKITSCLVNDRLPICPSGGEYNIPVVGKRPVCSFHGDLLATN